MANETVDTFDNIVNRDFHAAEFDTRLSLGRTLTGGAVATVGDAAASIWNSLPGTPEVQTADLLRNISADALQIYNENPDTVQAASFIAGSLLPIGLSTKGMGMLRGGSKGVNWFTKAGKEADMAAVTKLFSEAGKDTAEYRSLVRSTYIKGAANQALDAVAGEVAIMGLMNAHPLMEDYWQDPVKNFAIGIGLGAGIGGAIGHVADRYALRSMTGAIEAKAIGETLGTLRDVAPDMTNAVKLQSHEMNIQSMNAVLEQGKAAGKTAQNDLVMSFAESALLRERHAQVGLFEDIVSDKIKALPKEEKDAFMRAIIDKPEMYGVENVKFFTEAQATKSPLTKSGTAEIRVPVKPLESNMVTKYYVENHYDELVAAGKANSNEAIAYSLASGNMPFGAMTKDLETALVWAAAKKDTHQELFREVFAAAQARIDGKDVPGHVKTFLQQKVNELLGDRAEIIATKGVPKALTDKPVLSKIEIKKSINDEIGVGTQTSVQSVYYPELGKYGTTKDVNNYGNAAIYGKTVQDLKKELPSNFGKIPNLDSSLEIESQASAAVHKQYIAARAHVEDWDADKLAKAVLGENDLPLMSAIVMKMKSDFELQSKVRITLHDKSPVQKAFLESAPGGRNAYGLPQTYAQGTQKFLDADWMRKSFDPRKGSNGDAVAARLVNDWVAGDQQPINRMAQEWAAKGFSATGKDEHAAMKFDALYNSVGSQKLRAEFLQVADPDGYVYLYRGVKLNNNKDIYRANILEPHTTDPLKAAEFTKHSNGQVRLVKVHVDNIAGGWIDDASQPYRNEILVLPAANAPEAVLSGDLKNLTYRKLEAQLGTADVTGASKGKQVMYGDLEELLVQEKQRLIDDMLRQGYPMEAISIKSDTPLSAVMDYAHMQKDGSVSLSDFYKIEDLIKTKSVADAEEAIRPKNAPIILEGNATKNPYIEGHQALSNKNMKDISDTFMMAIMSGSGSGAARELSQYIYGDWKVAMDIMKAELGKANNELAGSKMINSTDFWARNMGSIGPIATNVGKQVQRITNDLIKKIVSPISDAMAVVAKDPAATVEFNTFINLNASLKGWRMFDSTTGQLMQRVEKVGENGKPVTVLEAAKLDGKTYAIATPEVRSLIEGMNQQGKELFDLTNTSRKILGKADISDIGLWVPSMNPVNKFIAYVHDLGTDTTKLLYANNKAEYVDMVRNYKKYLADSGKAGGVQVVTKDEQAMWNVLNGRLDVMSMERADVSMLKGGSSSSAIVNSGLGVFSELAGGYEHYITSQMRNIAELNMHEVTAMLDNMSAINQATVKSQPFGELKKVVTQEKDAAAVLKNTLLGNSNLGEHAGWAKINQSFETGLTFGVNAVTDAWRTVTEPVQKALFGGKKAMTPELAKKIDYEEMSRLLASKGIHNPWAAFDKEAANMFGMSKLEDHKDSSKRIIYASNALAATVALRIGELAQPLVNILSLPILTGLATASKMPAEFMGVARGTAELGPFGGVKLMYEGARAANSPMWRKLDADWAKQGYYSPLVSEVSNILRASRSFEKGAVSKIESALDSKMVQIMSKPADLSESFVRRQTMFTGAVLAKRLYPELSDAGITIFARDFMDKAVGNFHASQRPVFFQGTLGVALGLFQTYMLTLGQSVYRQLEMRNYKALGKAALTQSGIFGVESMPGFKEVSTMIGDHFSDENVDLTTGTYRALGSKAADIVLYGLPSNLGPSLHTRGDVSIRPPNVLGGLQNTVAVSFVSQTMDMMESVQNSLKSDNKDMARAFGQALAMQSMSRPLARGAELATGYSTTRKGNTVQTPEEVWTAQGIISRVLATRPLEESKLREAMHLNTFYGSKDRERRQEVTNQLKTAIRGGELSQEQIEKFSGEYLRKGGTPTGWRSALNTAIAQTDSSGKMGLIEKLKPNNPLNFMIDNLD